MWNDTSWRVLVLSLKNKCPFYYCAYVWIYKSMSSVAMRHFLAHFIVQIWLVLCLCMMFGFSRLHVCSPRCSQAFSMGSFTTLVDSSLNVTHYWKTTPPCTSKEPLHWPWSCRNVTVSTPPWHYTGEKGLYLHMKTLAIKYPTQPFVEPSVCLALNGLCVTSLLFVFVLYTGGYHHFPWCLQAVYGLHS